MRATEITPLRDDKKGKRRLIPILLGVAFCLTIALAALIADLWLHPVSDGPVAQAVGLTPSPTPSPVPSPTALPTVPPPSPAPTASPPPTAQPLDQAAPAPQTPPPCVPPDDWAVYTVQPGNTLDSLARRYGVSVETLMHVNCLNTQTLFVDQHLYVPGPAPSATPLLPVEGQASPTPPPLGEMSALATLPPTATPLSPFHLNIPGHYLNIVLLGSDKRPRSGAWRTDSMIIVSVDERDRVVRLLSIPRDLWVYIPGHGYNRINTADLWGELAHKGGGPERVKQTIYYNLGIPIHYYVRVDFQGFINIIDTVGGVDIDVDCPLPDINLTAGMHHMDGQQALRYARSRKSTSAFDRERRQRKVLTALWDQALNLDLIPRLPELWRTMADSFQTDLPLEKVLDLAYLGAQLEPQRIRSAAIGPRQTQGWTTPQGASVQLPRQEAIRSLLENFYAPLDLNRLDQTSQIRVRVLNGSPRHEAEQLAAAALKWEGFRVVGSGLADRQDYAQTSVLVYSDNPETLSAAERAARSLRVPPAAVQNLVGVEQPDPANPVDILIILGRDYNPCQR